MSAFMVPRHITPQDIIPLEDYLINRDSHRQRIRTIKRWRRIPVGPDVMMYFENFDTLLFQIQEMLCIERGGDPQLQDELTAYNPLVPQGSDLVATLMIEIPQAERRLQTLKALGHIEHSISLKIGTECVVKATPVDSEERTTMDGKTSSVHFLKFSFSESECQEFKNLDTGVILSIDHPHYAHAVTLSPETREALMEDFRD